MIPPLGGGGQGFDSPLGPPFCLFCFRLSQQTQQCSRGSLAAAPVRPRTVEALPWRAFFKNLFTLASAKKHTNTRAGCANTMPPIQLMFLSVALLEEKHRQQAVRRPSAFSSSCAGKASRVKNASAFSFTTCFQAPLAVCLLATPVPGNPAAFIRSRTCAQRPRR